MSYLTPSAALIYSLPQSRLHLAYESKYNRTADKNLRIRDCGGSSRVLTEPSRHAFFSSGKKYFLKIF
jgi:hypothetical protein